MFLPKIMFDFVFKYLQSFIVDPFCFTNFGISSHILACPKFIYFILYLKLVVFYISLYVIVIWFIYFPAESQSRWLVSLFIFTFLKLFLFLLKIWFLELMGIPAASYHFASSQICGAATKIGTIFMTSVPSAQFTGEEIILNTVLPFCQ